MNNCWIVILYILFCNRGCRTNSCGCGQRRNSLDSGFGFGLCNCNNDGHEDIIQPRGIFTESRTCGCESKEN